MSLANFVCRPASSFGLDAVGKEIEELGKRI